MRRNIFVADLKQRYTFENKSRQSMGFGIQGLAMDKWKWRLGGHSGGKRAEMKLNI